MKDIPRMNVSESTKRRNPQLYPQGIGYKLWSVEKAVKHLVKPRLRQSSKPLLNRLETECLAMLLQNKPESWQAPMPQAVTFRLASGVRYTPDLFSFDWGSLGELNMPTAFEVKGRWFTDDAVVKLKVFAANYPQIRVFLLWREDGIWQSQLIRA